jgi:hypothetical protein
MEICTHLIKTEEIIGIGPLMVESHPDMASRTLWNAKRFAFQVHCRQRSIEITSDYYHVGTGNNPNAEEAEARKKYYGFKSQYEEARKKIEELLMLPTR